MASGPVAAVGMSIQVVVDQIVAAVEVGQRGCCQRTVADEMGTAVGVERRMDAVAFPLHPCHVKEGNRERHSGVRNKESYDAVKHKIR